MAVLPFLRDSGPGGGSLYGGMRGDEPSSSSRPGEVVDHRGMPSDSELSPLVRSGTKLNREALKAFLNDNVEELSEAGRCKLGPGLKAPPGFKLLL